MAKTVALIIYEAILSFLASDKLNASRNRGYYSARVEGIFCRESVAFSYDKHAIIEKGS